MNTTFDQLAEIAAPHLKFYLDDLHKHDREALEKNAGVPFLHFTREAGTHMQFLPPADDACFPPAGVRVRYLFGTADRNHILDEHAATVRHYENSFNPPALAIVHFDGLKLRIVSLKKAGEIVSAYQSAVRREWAKPRQYVTY